MKSLGFLAMIAMLGIGVEPWMESELPEELGGRRRRSRGVRPVRVTIDGEELEASDVVVGVDPAADGSEATAAVFVSKGELVGSCEISAADANALFAAVGVQGDVKGSRRLTRRERKAANAKARAR